MRFTHLEVITLLHSDETLEGLIKTQHMNRIVYERISRKSSLFISLSNRSAWVQYKRLEVINDGMCGVFSAEFIIFFDPFGTTLPFVAAQGGC